MNDKHFHMAVGQIGGMVMADSQYDDAKESIMAFLGVSRNLFKYILKGNPVWTEQALYHMAENFEDKMVVVEGGPFIIYWIICGEGCQQIRSVLN